MRAASSRAQRTVLATVAQQPSRCISSSARHLSARSASSLPSTASSLQSLLRRSFSTSDEPLTPFPSHPPHKLPPAPKPVLDHQSSKYTKHVTLAPNQRLIILGFGAIGQGVLPLLFRHIGMKAEQVVIAAVDFSPEAAQHAKDYQVKTQKVKLLKDDYKEWLKANVKKGDFLVNVSVDVSSVALIEHCQVSPTSSQLSTH